MTRHILEAWKKDIEVRTHGLEKTPAPPRVQVHEIPHPINRIEELLPLNPTAELAGNTAMSIDNYSSSRLPGIDAYLLHEMYADSMIKAAEQHKVPSREYFAAFHTSAKELAKVASDACPKLLVLYHQMGSP